MLINTKSSPVEISSSLGTSSFSIAMNAKAFRTLSDTLYQNKIGSIVREISCNALDGHTANGNVDQPFEVHLPDHFEPWFAVKDFGIGLTPDDIVTVFTKYFESTKEQTNEMIGAFGLGGKSPFSYTDQFTVTSITDGMSRAYSAYIGEDGLPRIDLMAEFPTGEPTGVEVKIGVNVDDYRKFADELKDQLRWFRVKPNVINAPNFSWHDDITIDSILETDNVLITNSAVGYYDSPSYILQGNVGYPLNVSNLGDGVSKENRNLLDSLRTNIVLYKFDIGQIGVTASREAIEYNKTTVANIDAKLDVIRAELEAFVNEKLENIETDWERAKFLNSHVVLRNIAKASGYESFDINDSYSGIGFNFQKCMLNEKDTGIGYVKGLTNRAKSTILYPKHNVNQVVIIRDTANRPNMRAKYYATENRISDVNVWEIVLNNRDNATEEFRQSVQDVLGGFEGVILASSIELPKAVVESKARECGEYTRPKYYSMVDAAGSNIRGWERKFDSLEDIDDEMVYVAIQDMEAIDLTPHTHNGVTLSVWNTISSLKAMGKASLPIIGIRKNDLKRIEGKDNFVHIEDYVRNELETINISAMRIQQKHSMIRYQVERLLGDYINKDIVVNVENENLLKRLRRFVDGGPSDNNYDYKVRNLIGNVYYNVNSKIANFKNVIFDKYPLLKSINYYSHMNVTNEEYAEYINLVDRAA